MCVECGGGIEVALVFEERNLVPSRPVICFVSFSILCLSLAVQGGVIVRTGVCLIHVLCVYKLYIFHL